MNLENLLQGQHIQINMVHDGRPICWLDEISGISGVLQESSRTKRLTDSYIRNKEMGGIDYDDCRFDLHNGVVRIRCSSFSSDELFLTWLKHGMSGEHMDDFSVILRDVIKRKQQKIVLSGVGMRNVYFPPLETFSKKKVNIAVDVSASHVEGSLEKTWTNSSSAPGANQWLASNFELSIDGIEACRRVQTVSALVYDHDEGFFQPMQPWGSPKFSLSIPEARGREFLDWHAQTTSFTHSPQAAQKSGSLRYLSSDMRTSLLIFNIEAMWPATVSRQGDMLHVGMKCGPIQLERFS